MAAYYDIETFLDTIPTNFDTWNTTAKLGYYKQHIYGFETFTQQQQVQLADQYSTKQLKNLLQSYKVPQAFGNFLLKFMYKTESKKI